MPLLNGTDSSVISENIKELRNAGHPEPQAIAIAYTHAGKSKKPKTARPMGLAKPTIHVKDEGTPERTPGVHLPKIG